MTQRNHKPQPQRRRYTSLRDMVEREQRSDIEQRQAQRVREQLH